MANIQNLRPPKKGEPSRNPKGRPTGSRNRSTIVKEWLEAKEKIANPITGKTQRLSQADIITLALIKKARRGDVAAWNALMDSGYGKIADMQMIQQQGEHPVGRITISIVDGDKDPLRSE